MQEQYRVTVFNPQTRERDEMDIVANSQEMAVANVQYLYPEPWKITKMIPLRCESCGQ